MSLEDVPEEGEYVIGRVIEVKDFGATLNLLEFSERKAFVHISEVASGWVKYIRDFIREGQMVVAKVTKVKEGSKVVVNSAAGLLSRACDAASAGPGSRQRREMSAEKGQAQYGIATAASKRRRPARRWSWAASCWSGCRRRGRRR